jgi:hypothetical protein
VISRYRLSRSLRLSLEVATAILLYPAANHSTTAAFDVDYRKSAALAQRKGI